MDSQRLFSRSSGSFLASILEEPEKLYLVPHRWLSQYGDTDGVLYHVDGKNCVEPEEIVMFFKELEECELEIERSTGCIYALLDESLWFHALKWHNDSKLAEMDVNTLSLAKDNIPDIFSLKIGTPFLRGINCTENCLEAKIRLKDNNKFSFRKASDIFNFRSQPLHIWDYSGQITEFVSRQGIGKPEGSSESLFDEISVDLTVYGFSDSGKGGDHQTEGKITGTSSGTSSVKMNWGRNHGGSGLLGLTGLLNLQSAHFMNSAIQCLAHTRRLIDYFLDAYKIDINLENPFGMNGEVALAFGDLIKKLWFPGSKAVSPILLNRKVSTFAPQFFGDYEIDSQEFLAFILEGLHQGVKRVKSIPYIEANDANHRPDKEVAEEFSPHILPQKDSIIADLFEGQYGSTLICPVCKKKSVTSDHFWSLSLSLPSSTIRTITVTVLSTDGTTLPSPVTVMAPECGSLKGLIDALISACSLRDDETLLVAKIHRSKILRWLKEPSDSLSSIRDVDKLVAYRLPKDSLPSPLIVFIHGRVQLRPYNFKWESDSDLFGTPLVTRLSNISNRLDLQKQFLTLLKPFLMSDDKIRNDYDDALVTAIKDCALDGSFVPKDSYFQFYSKVGLKWWEIGMKKPLQRAGKELVVRVFWPDKMVEKYDICLLEVLPEVCKRPPPQEPVSLYKCLEGFFNEEVLGAEDMWHCPSCKKPGQATKKLDIWRSPEILVIHLKRFPYGVIKSKIETMVEFPIEGLDVSNFTVDEDRYPFSVRDLSNCYDLYGIINHFEGPHYTAVVNVGHGKWAEFDDEKVVGVSKERIVTSAAYILFYKRRRRRNNFRLEFP